MYSQFMMHGQKHIKLRHLLSAILHFVISWYSLLYKISLNKATALGNKHKE